MLIEEGRRYELKLEKCNLEIDNLEKEIFLYEKRAEGLDTLNKQLVEINERQAEEKLKLYSELYTANVGIVNLKKDNLVYLNKYKQEKKQKNLYKGGLIFFSILLGKLIFFN